MGIVESGIRVFADGIVGGILSEGHAVAASGGPENFAHVIQRLAEGVRSAQGQLLEKIVGPEFALYRVVVGVSGVGAETKDALSAVLASEIRTRCAGSNAGRR